MNNFGFIENTCYTSITVMLINHLRLYAGWLTAEQNTWLDFDLENTPLEIKTDSAVGSDKDLQVNFISGSGTRLGGIMIRLKSPPQYRILKCSQDQAGNPTTLSSDSSNIWRISLARITSSEIRLTIHCNNQEVLNVVLSDTVCNKLDSNWRTYWGQHVAKIKFSSTHDVADYYRAYTPGIEQTVNKLNCEQLKQELIVF